MKKIEINKILSWYLNNYQVNEIIKKYTGLNNNQLFFCDDLDIKEEKINEIKKLLEKKVPYEYIVNKAEFFSLDFYVDSRVLIPRNDTEIMVNETIKEINKKDKIEYIDIWTWSSCIAISVIKNINKDKIIKSSVIDISKEALEVSKINIKKHAIKNITQIESNLLEKYKESSNYKVITANLPYIKNNDFDNMSIETINYEPDLALYWWEKTWFELYEKLIEQCKKIWNITLFIEIWFDQKEYSKLYLENKNLKNYYYKDNSWIDRCIKIIF